MTGLADGIDASAYPVIKSNGRYAPFKIVEEAEPRKKRSRSGAGVLAAFLVLSGITVAFSRGQAVIVESFGISQESVLGIAWVLQGVAALICFIFVVRWLRS